MIKTRKIYFIILLLTCISCQNYSKNVFLDKAPLLVKTFETKVELKGEKVPIDLIGMSDIFIYDTLLLFTQPQLDKLYSLVSLNDYTFLGSFVGKGRAENEFTSIHAPLYSEIKDGNLFLAFSDNTLKKIRFLNITETIASQKAVFRKQEIDMKKFNTLYRLYPIESDKFFVDFLDIETVSQHYSIFDTNKNDIIIDNAAIDMKVSSLNSSFLLATNTSYNHSLQKYASGMNFVNQINIFDIQNPTESFSISTSGKQKTTRDIENTPMPEKMEYYYDLRSTDQYIFGLYADQNRKSWAIEDKPGTIHVFDWSGNPIAELSTKEKIMRFDIDTTNNKLYGMTLLEELFVYDLPVF